MSAHNPPSEFVRWFRHSSPYIHAFRGRTFVIVFDGAAVEDERFPDFIHDVALLSSLGIRLVLVHGDRPQIARRLRERGIEAHFEGGVRITDDEALACVKEAAGTVRVEIEALLSMGLANSPMAGARIRVASGNFVTARPLGVRDGIDYGHTGEVRRIDAEAIGQRLDSGAIVLLSPLGYSPTGEVFNLASNEVATATAIALGADKLIFLTEADRRRAKGALPRELTLQQARALAERMAAQGEPLHYLPHAIEACRRGVRRVHLVERERDGALLQELFTRDGVGVLVSADSYEDLRPATIEDVGGILNLIEPLERQGVLVRRSREQLELEIGHFTVVARDSTIIACAALYPYEKERVAELACVAVHPDYRNAGRGDALLQELERRAREAGIERIFVLTTQTAHWFRERGYQPAEVDDLPVARQRLYNYQRRAKVFIKRLDQPR